MTVRRMVLILVALSMVAGTFIAWQDTQEMERIVTNVVQP